MGAVCDSSGITSEINIIYYFRLKSQKGCDFMFYSSYSNNLSQRLLKVRKSLTLYDYSYILNEIVSMPLSVFSTYILYPNNNFIKRTNAFWLTDDSIESDKLDTKCFLPEILKVNSNFTVGQACDMLMQRRIAAKDIPDNMQFLVSDPVSALLFDLLIRPALTYWSALNNGNTLVVNDHTDPYSSHPHDDAESYALSEHDKKYKAEPTYYHPLGFRSASFLDKKMITAYHSNYNSKTHCPFITWLFTTEYKTLYDAACVEVTCYSSEKEKYEQLTSSENKKNVINSTYINAMIELYNMRLSKDCSKIQIPAEPENDYQPTWFNDLLDNQLVYENNIAYRAPSYYKPEIIDTYMNNIIFIIATVYNYYLKIFPKNCW